MKVEFYNANPEYIDYLKKYETSLRGKTCVPNVQYASKNNKFFTELFFKSMALIILFLCRIKSIESKMICS